MIAIDLGVNNSIYDKNYSRIYFLSLLFFTGLLLDILRLDVFYYFNNSCKGLWIDIYMFGYNI